jgi:hypothetical protein
VNPVPESLELRTMRTSDMDQRTRETVVRLCIDAHQEEDFQNLFSYLPPEGLHVLAYLDERLVGHAVVTIRWLQAGNGPLLRAAYVDAVATSPTHQALAAPSCGISRRSLATVTSLAWRPTASDSTNASVGNSGVAPWAAGPRRASFRRRTRAAS